MSELEDREIEGKVRWALAKDARIRAAELIHISVESGVVQLWGEVASAAEKTAAEELASSQRGVKNVEDALSVAMETPKLDQRRELASAVEQALSQASGPRAKDVGVAAVEHGVVRLVGHAHSLAEERAAIAAVAAVPGVSEVISEVSIGEVAPSEAIETIDDATIKGMVNSAIAERGVTIFDEDTIVDGGIVYLRGHVLDQGEQRLAEEAAAAVSGVRDTVNELILDHDLASRDADEALGARITAALRRDGRVSPADVHAQVVRGDVRLYGYVDSIEDQNAAVDVARRVRGVRNVFSDVVLRDRTSLGKSGQRQVNEQELGRERGS